MPAIEAEAVEVAESNSYELAFHVLPTVAEGEVASVFDAIKDAITKSGAEIFDEEAPERFELAYEIIKPYEGKNRKFTSAYFGWVRFKNTAEVIEIINESVEANSSILRYILIKLTKLEEANPFRFHEELASQKMVTDIEDVSGISDETESEKESEEAEKTEEKKEEKDSGEADKAEIDEALDKSDV